MGQIYMATCKTTGLSYIGQSINWKVRKTNHLVPSANDCYFHRAIRKYGKDDFVWQVLEDNIPKEKLSEREVYWISYYNTYLGPGYNETKGGDGNFDNCHKWQLEHPEEFKKIQEKAIKAALKWRRDNPEIAREMSLKALEKAREGWKEWCKKNPEEMKRNQMKASLIGAKKVAKKVRCIELNRIFPSVLQAKKELNIDDSSICKVCKGKRGNCRRLSLGIC